MSPLGGEEKKKEQQQQTQQRHFLKRKKIHETLLCDFEKQTSQPKYEVNCKLKI